MLALTLQSGAELLLDGLILSNILEQLGAADLAAAAATASALRFPAYAAARAAIERHAARLDCTPLHDLDDSVGPIARLSQWEQLDEANILWLRAEQRALIAAQKDGELRVRACEDLSGRNHHAASEQHGPVFNPNAVNGHGAFEFDGNSVLKTRPFAMPVPQPLTLVVVARARGDTTIVDALGTSSSRFELCHGYPSGWHPSPEICMTASGHDAVPSQSMRGSTRGDGEWHVFTAIFDVRKSELYVDGVREASGKNVGNNRLDGLSIGCDHSGVFFLIGSVAELRLFSIHLSPEQRVQVESTLARKYNLSYKMELASSSPVESPPSLANKSRLPPLLRLRRRLSRSSSNGRVALG
mmetsp:Transcript_25819/g.78500  ORF Transcript_25819/g.78500 Transcript_25819/m.78500 type:complete len:356 (-) Transcript_25819:758-1825(-)